MENLPAPATHLPNTCRFQSPARIRDPGAPARPRSARGGAGARFVTHRHICVSTIFPFYIGMWARVTRQPDIKYLYALYRMPSGDPFITRGLVLSLHTDEMRPARSRALRALSTDQTGTRRARARAHSAFVRRVVPRRRLVSCRPGWEASKRARTSARPALQMLSKCSPKASERHL